MPGGGTAGRGLAGPSWLCSAVYTAGDSVGPVGFSGPVTWVRILLASSLLVATASGPGFCHTGALNRKISVVGFAADCGKYLLSRVCPAAESVPDGGAVLPPKPAAVKPKTANERPPKRAMPARRVGA